MNTPVAIDDMRKGISSKELEQQRTEQKKTKQTNRQKQKNVLKSKCWKKVCEHHLTMKSFSKACLDDRNNIHK